MLTTSWSSVFTRLKPSVRCCDVDHRFDHCCPITYAGRWCRWDVEQSPFTVVDIDLCWRQPHLLSKAPRISVASHWMERSSCRFPVTLIIISWADHSTSQVLITFHVVFINFYWRLASKSLHVLSDLRLVPRLWRRTLQLLLMHIVFRSLLKIFVYTAKQACKQLQCNKAKLLEPINGLHNQKGLG